MEKRGLEIVWNKNAVDSFVEALTWIGKESVQQDENVGNSIIAKIEELASAPEKYPPCKFKTNNNGSFRALK